MTQEKIDVLVPAYNAEKTVAKTLESLANQTYKNLRIVVVNDGSTDQTAKVLEDCQKKYPNIEVFYKENEKSIAKTRNFLLTKIQSKFFSFFDSDDYAEPDYFEKLYNALIENDADMSICKVYRHKENKKVDFKKLNKKPKNEIFNQHEFLCEMLSYKKFTGTCYSKLMKSSLIGSASFDKDIWYGEDLDFCFKVAQNCQKFAFIDEFLYHYLIQPNSIVTSSFKPAKLTVLDCYDKIIDVVSGDEELSVCAKSMRGLIAVELLYYVWRDKVKDKPLKARLKQLIKQSIPFIRRNKRLSKLYRCVPAVWWLTKLM